MKVMYTFKVISSQKISVNLKSGYGPSYFGDLDIDPKESFIQIIQEEEDDDIQHSLAYALNIALEKTEDGDQPILIDRVPLECLKNTHWSLNS